MRVAIIDDEQASVTAIKKNVEYYCDDVGIDCVCSTFNDGMEFVTNYKSVWDVIFLDIEMPLLDGLSTARTIRKVDSEVIIVFVTKTAQYAVDGYEVNALDYIVKPLNYYAFSMKMQRIQSILGNRSSRSIIVKSNEVTKKVEIASLQYVEVTGHTLIYHTTKGDFSSTGTRTLKSLYEDLKGDNFGLCNQCYLINYRHVDSFDRDDVILTNGERLGMSRKRRNEFVKAVLDYWDN